MHRATRKAVSLALAGMLTQAVLKKQDLLPHPRAAASLPRVNPSQRERR